MGWGIEWRLIPDCRHRCSEVLAGLELVGYCLLGICLGVWVLSIFNLSRVWALFNQMCCARVLL
jgi:hypothetical protein